MLFLDEDPAGAGEISHHAERGKEACSMNSLITRLTRIFYLSLCFSVALLVLSSCSGGTTITPPPVWKNYQGSAFTLSYLSNWEVATKDFYLGTQYPQLEMLQGMVFIKQGSASTFLQVEYAVRTNSLASAKDIMLKFLLGSSGHPAPASSLSQTILAGENWYQGTVEKRVSQGGSTLSIKETVLGVDRVISSKSTEIYLLFYQDVASTYSQNVHDFFTRMVKSFRFAS